MTTTPAGGTQPNRRHLLNINPHIGFTGGANDYLIVHHLADQFLDQHWSTVLAVAEVLAARLHLTGDHIADLAGAPNGTHSATCTA